jgi:hypothetical protein
MITSVLEPESELQGVETFSWCWSCKKVSAPAPCQKQESHILIFIDHESII